MRVLQRDRAPVPHLNRNGIALGPDGYPRIAYQVFGSNQEPDGEPHNILGLIQCGDDDCDGYSQNSMVTYTSANLISSITVGSDGTAYVVYDSGNDEDGPQGIGLATCSGTNCSTADIASDLGPEDALGATIAIAADGTPAIAYVVVDPWYGTESVYITPMAQAHRFLGCIFFRGPFYWCRWVCPDVV